MQGQRGDRIFLTASKVGGATREGEIIEVIEGELRISYQVHWSDGHESLISPGAGAAAFLPPIGTDKSARSAKKSTAKKSTAKKPTAKKPTAKKH